MIASVRVSRLGRGVETTTKSLASGRSGLRPREPKFVSLTIASRSSPTGRTASIVW
jgi:hypothetical protein